MKKLTVLLMGVFLLLQVSGTTHAATTAPYAATVSASLYDISFAFHDIYDTKNFDENSVTLSPGSFYSNTYVNDIDGTTIDSDWDSSIYSSTSADLNGPGYESGAATTVVSPTDFRFDSYVSADSGQATASAEFYADFSSSERGLMQISFSYDLMTTLTDFNEDGYTMADISIFVSSSEGSGGSYSETSFWKSLASPWNATDGEWSDMSGTYDFFIGLEKDKTYSVYTDVFAYANTAEPFSTPVPGAVWLLGTGVLGLAGIRRKKQR